MQVCLSYGIETNDAAKLLTHLNESGSILHFPNNRDLDQYIFLKPQRVFQAATEAMDVKLLRVHDEVKVHELEVLEAAFVPMNKEKL